MVRPVRHDWARESEYPGGQCPKMGGNPFVVPPLDVRWWWFFEPKLESSSRTTTTWSYTFHQIRINHIKSKKHQSIFKWKNINNCQKTFQKMVGCFMAWPKNTTVGFSHRRSPAPRSRSWADRWRSISPTRNQSPPGFPGTPGADVVLFVFLFPFFFYIHFFLLCSIYLSCYLFFLLCLFFC